MSIIRKIGLETLVNRRKFCRAAQNAVLNMFEVDVIICVLT